MMIPRAKAANQIFGNPSRNRVTNCRKRLRDNRGVPPHIEPADVDTQKLAQFPADSPAVRQLVRLDLSPSLGEKQACEKAETVRDEVGIT